MQSADPHLNRVLMPPREQSEHERHCDEADPERGEDPEHALPEVPTDPVPGGAPGDQESAQTEEAVDGNGPEGGLTEHGLTSVAPDRGRMGNDDGDGQQ